MKGLAWRTTEGVRNLNESRLQLDKAHAILRSDPLNPELCNSVKTWTEEVLKQSDMEERILQQRAKEDCIKLGDGNNKFFYAKLKAKNAQTQIKQLQTATGRFISEPAELEEEVLDFYSNLIGQAAPSRTHVDISILRKGSQLTRDHQNILTRPVTEEEILIAVKSLGDNKSPGIGYTGRFFKASWSLIKSDIVKAVQDFFINNRMHRAVNCAIVTLIPKTKEAKSMKEM
ncbi:uncharacterized protein LOC131598573 [Vicia villosa]|uniref:uncharacterized protein LOC131598573 n=1 Tax=Vicia villosa TaxID=3911 RepID=UPI00273C7CEF|nr:uncharacterized protein LOC131598573 [Vicia villosa]